MKVYTHPMEAKGPTYVGSRLVYPGETVVMEADGNVMVDTHGVALNSGAVLTPASDEAVNVVELQKGSVASITAGLPVLTEGELAQLLDLEQKSAKPRVSLVTAIETQMLKLTNGAGEEKPPV